MMNVPFKSITTAVLTATILLFALPSLADTQTGTHSPNLGNSPMEGTETFQAFGGREGLVKIMDDFMIGLVADPRTKPFFDNEKQTFIKAMLVEQMCELMNGGCKYPGRDMKTSHANMKVNREGFNALVEQFQLAMDKHKVPFSAQNKLLAKLAPMYREIEGTTGEAVPPKALN
jgi:hemoglobin